MTAYSPRFERLLSAVANRPEGEKVHIPSLVRVFTPTQAEIVAAIELLIARGKLDRTTLRTPCTQTETPARLHAEPSVAPEPEAPAGGDGDARKVAPSPSLDLVQLLEFFGAEWEPLGAIAARAGAASPQKIVRHARGLATAGLVETLPPVSGRAFLLWRRAQPAASAPEPKRKAPPNMAERARRFEADRKPGSRDEALLQFFTNEWELLGVVALRWGGGSAHLLRAPAQRLRNSGLLEFRQRDPQCLWRLAQPNTQGASGTAKEAPSAEESTSATRIEDRAPIAEPAPVVAPPARARLVDIKVNIPPAEGPHPKVEPSADAPTADESAVVPRGRPPLVEVRIAPRRDPTTKPETPLIDEGERSRERSYAHGAAIRRGQEAEATRLLDAGADPARQSSLIGNMMRSIARRREDEARLLDRVEQAKAVLRRKGYTPVVGAEYADPPGPKGQFLVGRLRVSEKIMLQMAGLLA